MEIGSVGLLHPGEMGAGIGAALVSAGYEVRWASVGRRPASRRRAEAAGFIDVGSVEAIASTCDLVMSVCPPAAALDVARQVTGFKGLYLDANAIAPGTAREVARVIESEGGRYVDGGIIGSPPAPAHVVHPAHVTHLYLSGPAAPEVREVFAKTPIDAQVIAGNPVAASALKMCFAAWSKGTTALLLDVRALATTEGVEGDLLAAWKGSVPDLAARSLTAAQQAATKGWRWVGEMEEIAATFRSAGLPDGFHRAAAEVYRRPARDEEAPADATTLAKVLGAMTSP
jgi:3-hydroxyisobutyrate dehydrogenase-like beta-hydroxyacid dehydrogenase